MTLYQYYTLFPIIILSGISLGVRSMMPLSWGKGLVLQSCLVLLAVLIGVLLKNIWIAQIAGWTLFLLFHVPAWYIFGQAKNSMTRMNTDEMAKWGRLLPLVFWGLPGQFWKDMVDAYIAFSKENPALGEELLGRWLNSPALPDSLKDVPIQYGLYGNCLCWQWQAVVDDFEKLRFAARKASPMLYFSAARAYIELGLYKKAAECLRQSRFDESITPLDSLATALLPFFSLCGARNQVDQLLAVISEAKITLPEALSLYWMGRCLTKEGEIAQAQAAFEKALTKTEVPILRKRIQYALDQTNLDSEIVHKGSISFTVDDCRAEMKDIWSHFQRGAFIQEILAPRRRSPVVNGLLFINLAVFLLADPHFKLVPALALSIFSSGMLSDAVIKHGEYYRLLTYMFLHTTVIHLGVNMLGLLAFGRITENIFGTNRFLAIYFFGGVLSGVAHLLLRPDEPAVGASGAILAIFGAVGVGIWKLKAVLPESLRKRYLWMMVAIAMSQIVMDQFIPHIAVFAHLGGLIAGIALGAVTSIRTPSKEVIDGTQKFVEG
jgi:membrane associated rhomboid family serine protease